MHHLHSLLGACTLDRTPKLGRNKLQCFHGTVFFTDRRLVVSKGGTGGEGSMRDEVFKQVFFVEDE